MKRTTLMALVGLALAGSAHAASFDCAKAQTRVEKMICDTPAISKLDDEMSASYQAALQNQADAAAVKLAQKQWLKERNKCTNAACVKAAYAKRLLHTSAPPTSGYWDNQGPTNGAAKGKGYTVCDKVKDRLNAFTYPKNFNACSWRAIATMPGFTEPPWEDIDPKKHEALLYKLFKYRMYFDPKDYFSGEPPKNMVDPEGRIQASVREFFERSGRMRVWRTRLPLHTDYHTQDVTFVQLGQKNDRVREEATCKGFPLVEWEEYNFAVTDDLAGPDPRVDLSEKHTFVSDALLYAGKLHFVNSQMTIEISAAINERVLNNFCTIQYSKQGE